MQLVFGKNKQVSFNNEQELNEAVAYILSSDNVTMKHEDNQDQGAWASEERIIFKKEDHVPECLKRNMTAGKKGMYGRINCEEFVRFINENYSH